MRVRLISEQKELTGFRYFWGKTVTGFNPEVHCADCLIGEYSPLIHKTIPANEDILLEYPEGQVVYLCGVSTPYKWSHNAHLALTVREGASATLRLYTGDILTVSGAEQLLFDGKKAFARYPEKGKAYTTCRNFQFGVHYFQE